MLRIHKKNPWRPLAICGCLLLAGCSPQGDETPPDGSAEVTLEVVVVGDPALAASIEQLTGEWNAETGGEYRVEQMTAGQLEAAESLSGDAVILPTFQLGLVAERRQILPLTRQLLAAHDRSWSEIYDLARLHEAAWGPEVQAIPFGSPSLTCYYRADILRQLGRRPPKTWTEYRELAELLADRSKLGGDAPAAGSPWYGTIEPLGPGWAGVVLLARAASYAKHADHYSTLFDIGTMEPLVDGPPFVRALDELVAAAKLGPPEARTYDPGAVRAAFWQGRSGLALTWPTAVAKVPDASSGKIECGFAPAPGSRKVFDPAKDAWANRGQQEDRHVPLLAVAGYVGAVARESAHPEAALRLLFWLSGKQGTGSRQTGTTATTLFRESHQRSPQMWVESPVSPKGAVQYGKIVEQTLSRPQWLFALRIPGRAEYLAALDEAVRQAVEGRQTPQTALSQAAEQWRRITKRRGVEQQRNAYRHSLQLH